MQYLIANVFLIITSLMVNVFCVLMDSLSIRLKIVKVNSSYYKECNDLCETCVNPSSNCTK